MKAQRFSVWEYVQDCLDERGWSKVELAKMMGGNPATNFVSLDYLEQYPFDPRFTIGRDIAKKLEKVFAVSAETWMNLDKSARALEETQ